MNITEFFSTRYRIVHDSILKEYIPQYRYWWSPFYMNLLMSGFTRIEDAEFQIHMNLKGRFKVVKYID